MKTMDLPVRGNDAVEILTNDHRTVKSLLDELVQSTQKNERMQCLEHLKAALTIHNATEENLFYPALAKVAGKKSESEHLYKETAAADMLLFELDSMLKEGDDSKFASKAEKFREAVCEHIDDEEQKAFPHMEQHSDSEHTRMLTEAVREFRHKIHMGADGAMSERGEIPSSSPSRTSGP